MTASSSASWTRFSPVHLQILLMGKCRQCGSWSMAGHNHRKVIGRGPICTSWHDGPWPWLRTDWLQTQRTRSHSAVNEAFCTVSGGDGVMKMYGAISGGRLRQNASSSTHVRRPVCRYDQSFSLATSPLRTAPWISHCTANRMISKRRLTSRHQQAPPVARSANVHSWDHSDTAGGRSIIRAGKI